MILFDVSSYSYDPTLAQSLAQSLAQFFFDNDDNDPTHYC